MTAAAVLLALVFLLSAGLKLSRPGDTRLGFEDLGLPLPALAAVLVPAAEIGVAVLLLLSPAWGGVVAFAVLAGFTVFLVQLTRHGSPSPCRCFGASSTSPVGWLDVARNVAFMVLAVLAML